jgi:hypothetical protein
MMENVAAPRLSNMADGSPGARRATCGAASVRASGYVSEAPVDQATLVPGAAGLIDRDGAQTLLATLGFQLDEQTFSEVFDDVDSDDDNFLLLDEFITAVGMLKKSVLEVRSLDHFREAHHATPCALSP